MAEEGLGEPLLGGEPHSLEHRAGESATHSHEGRRGWLAEQLRASPGHDGAAVLLPAGYQQPKLSARTIQRHMSMPSSRARCARGRRERSGRAGRVQRSRRTVQFRQSACRQSALCRRTVGSPTCTAVRSAAPGPSGPTTLPATRRPPVCAAVPACAGAAHGS